MIYLEEPLRKKTDKGFYFHIWTNNLYNGNPAEYLGSSLTKDKVNFKISVPGGANKKNKTKDWVSITKNGDKYVFFVSGKSKKENNGVIRSDPISFHSRLIEMCEMGKGQSMHISNTYILNRVLYILQLFFDGIELDQGLIEDISDAIGLQRRIYSSRKEAVKTYLVQAVSPRLSKAIGVASTSSIWQSRTDRYMNEYTEFLKKDPSNKDSLLSFIGLPPNRLTRKIFLVHCYDNDGNLSCSRINETKDYLDVMKFFGMADNQPLLERLASVKPLKYNYHYSKRTLPNMRGLASTINGVSEYSSEPPTNARQKIETIKSLRSKFRAMIVRELFDVDSRTSISMASDLNDIVSMLTNYPEVNLLNRPKSIKELHDWVSNKVDLLKNPPLPIEHNEKYDGLHDSKFGDTSVLLPTVTTEIKAWGKHLRNCVGGFAREAATGDFRIIALERDGEVYACLGINPTGNISTNSFDKKFPQERL